MPSAGPLSDIRLATMPEQPERPTRVDVRLDGLPAIVEVGAPKEPGTLTVAGFSVRGEAVRSRAPHLRAFGIALGRLFTAWGVRLAPQGHAAALRHALDDPAAHLRVLRWAAGAELRGAAWTTSDFRFLAAFLPAVDPAHYQERRLALKRATLGELQPEFLAAPHVFVLGHARSGTRWLVRVLEEACRVGGATVRSGPMVEPDRAKLVAELERTGGLFAAPGELPVAATDAAALLMQRLCPVPGHLACKLSFECLSLLERFVHARPFVIVRDPRNVFLSKKAFIPDRPRHVREHLAGFVRGMAQARAVAGRIGAPCIRYEDMLDNPLATFEGLTRALGMSLDEPALRALVDQTSFKRMSGGREYGDRRDGEYLRGGSQWKTELGADDRAWIAAALGDELEALGYERE
ncbi:sulfotransferase [Paraliomyxa miuraensis]|uniref:sulfotransferase n=1 Tax=Paraliomyxa miuraensis TaxID=376150 RepID=UPI002257C9CA|nr:sulfotransferase [Paraliomyxa miuraensis]MCX4243625.1 sulfotransferase [Paraliomyxa miuraensis]